jgi:hypothetical protein
VAAELGYNNLFVLHEGMPVWEEKGYAVYAGPDYEKRIETTKITPQELKILMKPNLVLTLVINCKFAKDIPGATSRQTICRFGGARHKNWSPSANRGTIIAQCKLQKLLWKIVQAILADGRSWLPVTKEKNVKNYGSFDRMQIGGDEDANYKRKNNAICIFQSEIEGT